MKSENGERLEPRTLTGVGNGEAASKAARQALSRELGWLECRPHTPRLRVRSLARINPGMHRHVEQQIDVAFFPLSQINK